MQMKPTRFIIENILEIRKWKWSYEISLLLIAFTTHICNALILWNFINSNKIYLIDNF